MRSSLAVYGLLHVACTSAPRTDDQGLPQLEPATTGAATTADASTSGASGEESTAAEGDDGDDEAVRLDLPSSQSGCEAVDLLFVIDNSESMQTYQAALAAQFPAFAEAMFAALPENVSLHVGLTTTEFDAGCEAPEATQNCQSSSSVAEISEHYIKPTQSHDGGNGSQGRLFSWAGKRFFETTNAEDPAPLVQWFSQAAVAAGEDGCSFEMPVASAAWATSPVNAATNAGFIRDEGALLVVFFLTDEPDKSPESKETYRDMILAAKSGCGGNACVFTSGLIPSCTIDINQKLWQFMKLWSDDEAATPPSWGDITDTANYSAYFGDALATAVAQACAQVPVP